MASSTIKFFNCIPVGNRHLLVVEPAVDCDSDTYQSLLIVFAGLFLLGE